MTSTDSGMIGCEIHSSAKSVRVFDQRYHGPEHSAKLAYQSKHIYCMHLSRLLINKIPFDFQWSILRETPEIHQTEREPRRFYQIEHELFIESEHHHFD